MFNIPYMLFMAEAEGLLDDKDEKEQQPKYEVKEDDGDHSYDPYNYFD